MTNITALRYGTVITASSFVIMTIWAWMVA